MNQVQCKTHLQIEKYSQERGSHTRVLRVITVITKYIHHVLMQIDETNE